MDRSYLPRGLVADGSGGVIADRTSAHHGTSKSRLGTGGRTGDDTGGKADLSSDCYTNDEYGRSALTPVCSVSKDCSATRLKTFRPNKLCFRCDAGCPGDIVHASKSV